MLQSVTEAARELVLLILSTACDEHLCHKLIPNCEKILSVSVRLIGTEAVKQAVVNNTWTLEGRRIATMCSCVDTTLAASSPASGTVWQNVPGGSRVDTTFIINPHNFLLQAVRHKYFPHILSFVCFWTNMFVFMCMKCGLLPQRTT